MPRDVRSDRTPSGLSRPDVRPRFPGASSMRPLAVLSAGVTVLAAWTLLASTAVAQDKQDLAGAAYQILQKKCYDCHGPGNESAELDVTDRKVLLREVNALGKPVRPFLVPGKPGDSRIIEVVTGDNPRMPLQGDKLTPEEVKTLTDWIAADAPEYVNRAEGRQIVTQGEILESIQNFLITKVPAAKQQFRVFFSLAHISNNRSIDDRQMRLYRAALSKAINGMSRHNRIVVPDEVDANGTIYSVDIQQLGWMKDGTDFNLWQKVLAEYPYGVAPVSGAKTKAAFNAYDRLTRNRLLGAVNFKIPYIHADWFISVVTRSDTTEAKDGVKLYYELLDIPTKVADLESRLGVKRETDFTTARLRRAGVIISGVSAQNRLVDIHPTANQGNYWISYDFERNNGKGNIVRFPLGPSFTANQFNDFAFDHAGGEIIWRLANGLHGYMLIDTKGDRIDKGPVSIVRDLDQTSGTPEIVNGLSCMKCHLHGMIKFNESVRDNFAISDQALDRANEIYLDQAGLNAELEAETKAYCEVLDRAIGGYLKVGEDSGKDIKSFPEPVGFVARRYMSDLLANEAGLELSFDDPRDLVTGISFSDALQKLGLSPLSAGKTVKRTYWSAREADGSPFQQTAKALNRGLPIIVPRVQ